ncbi:MAG TPA: hypothetical protein VN363_10575 [Anaerolineales bacterium]|nr:hypothetical protein [Anaerolineales bacterium]
MIFLVLFFLLHTRAAPAYAQALTPTAPAGTNIPSPTIGVSAPVAGQALQGVIAITGNSAIPEFSRAELSFAYATDTTGTWFLIAESQTPVENGTLGQWDTTTITDGEYQLRLVVYLTGGQKQIATNTGLRVRNYTAVETETPTPSATMRPGNTPAPSNTPTPTSTPVPPTGTPVPPNPAIIGPGDLLRNMGRGALGIVGIFSLIGIYRGLHSLIQKRSRQ